MNQKVVLITGALTGIGRAAATCFARRGAHVVISGRNSEIGDELADSLCATGAQVEFRHVDVRYDDEVEELIHKTLERFGRIDVAVNAAGTGGSLGPVVDHTVEEFAEIFDTNVLGTFLCVKYELGAMLPRERGSIINISSHLGQRGAAGSSLYSASGHAVEGLTKTAALETAASNVRINAIAPGPIDTYMLERFVSSAPDRATGLIDSIPLKRIGTPEEVASVIAFLASDQASSITGQIIGVDGGKMA